MDEIQDFIDEMLFEGFEVRLIVERLDNGMWRARLEDPLDMNHPLCDRQGEAFMVSDAMEAIKAIHQLDRLCAAR